VISPTSSCTKSQSCDATVEALEDELPSRLCPPNRGVAVRRNPVNAEGQLERHTLPGLQAGALLTTAQRRPLAAHQVGGGANTCFLYSTVSAPENRNSEFTKREGLASTGNMPTVPGTLGLGTLSTCAHPRMY